MVQDPMKRAWLPGEEWGRKLRDYHKKHFAPNWPEWDEKKPEPLLWFPQSSIQNDSPKGWWNGTGWTPAEPHRPEKKDSQLAIA